MVQLHLIFANRWLLFITCYLWLAIWIFLFETYYFLQKLVPFARCCTSRYFLSQYTIYLSQILLGSCVRLGVFALSRSDVEFLVGCVLVSVSKIAFVKRLFTAIWYLTQTTFIGHKVVICKTLPNTENSIQCLHTNFVLFMMWHCLLTD